MAKATPYGTDDLRTFALAGHRSSGKTSLAEVLLQHARVTRSVGRTDDGTSLLDHSPEERRHRQSLQMSVAWFEHRDRLVQLIDTPGAEVAATERALGILGADAVLVAVDVGGGVEIGAEGAVAQARAVGLPVIGVITKLDRLTDPASVEASVRALEDVAGVRAAQLHLPFFGDDGSVQGLVDVLERRVLRYAADGSGACSPEPLSPDLEGAVRRARERIAETVALTDDGLLERYLEDLELPDDLLRRGLAVAVASGQLMAVVLTSAATRIGAGPLLDAVVDLVPSPARRAPPRAFAWDGTPFEVGIDGEFIGQVLATQFDVDGNRWHTVRVWRGVPDLRRPWIHGRSGVACPVRRLYRVRGPRRAQAKVPITGQILGVWDTVSARPGDTLTCGERLEMRLPAIDPPLLAWWIRPVDGRRTAEVHGALRQLVECDRGLELHTDEVTGAVLLAAASEVQLSLAVERLQRRYGFEVHHSLPPVAYRETPAAAIAGVCGTHVREGEHGLVSEYGQCEVGLAPSGDDSSVAFVDLVTDDEDLPPRYRPAIDQGAREAMRRGPTAGYPVVGVELRLTGGSYDILQSTDDHFRLAGEKATRTALERAGTRLLEPWWEVQIHAPQVVLGDLISDISAHRGRILGMEVEGEVAQITAHCPYRELRTFPMRLQGLSGGRGRLSWKESHYEPVPAHLVQEAIETSPFRGG